MQGAREGAGCGQSRGEMLGKGGVRKALLRGQQLSLICEQGIFQLRPQGALSILLLAWATFHHDQHDVAAEGRGLGRDEGLIAQPVRAECC